MALRFFARKAAAAKSAQPATPGTTDTARSPGNPPTDAGWEVMRQGHIVGVPYESECSGQTYIEYNAQLQEHRLVICELRVGNNTLNKNLGVYLAEETEPESFKSSFVFVSP